MVKVKGYSVKGKHVKSHKVESYLRTVDSKKQKYNSNLKPTEFRMRDTRVLPKLTEKEKQERKRDEWHSSHSNIYDEIDEREKNKWKLRKSVM